MTTKNKGLPTPKSTPPMPKVQTPVQPVATAKILDALPSMIGAIDRSLVDITGEKTAFVLIVFAAGVGMHATNINPPADAIKAVKALASNWDDGDAAE